KTTKKTTRQYVKSKTTKQQKQTKKMQPSTYRYYQEERQILRHQRHFSRCRIRAPNNHRTNGSTNGTLHQLTEFQEGISRDGRGCQDNGSSGRKGTQPYCRTRIRGQTHRERAPVLKTQSGDNGR